MASSVVIPGAVGFANVAVASDVAARVPIGIHPSPFPVAACVPIDTAACVPIHYNDCVGISVHSKSVKTDAVKADITEIHGRNLRPHTT